MKGLIRGFVAGIIVTVTIINAPDFIQDVANKAKLNHYMEEVSMLESIGANSADHDMYEYYQTCTSTVVEITVSVKASYPLVDVNGTPAMLTRATDEGHYAGDVDIDLTGSETITVTVTTPDNQQGAQDTAFVTVSP